jgi:hypothetical protein
MLVTMKGWYSGMCVYTYMRLAIPGMLHDETCRPLDVMNDVGV